MTSRVYTTWGHAGLGLRTPMFLDEPADENFPKYVVTQDQSANCSRLTSVTYLGLAPIGRVIR